MTPRTFRVSLILAMAASSASYASAQAPAPVPSPDEAARTLASPAEAPVAHHEDQGLVEGGMTADDAARLAVATSASLARADAVVQIAEAGRMQAFAALMPRLMLQGRATYTNPIVNNLSQADPQQLAFANQQLDIVRDNTGTLPGQNTSNLVIAEMLRGLINGFSNLNFPYYRSQYELSAQISYPVTAAVFTMLPMYRAAGRSVEAARLQRDVELSLIALRAREAFYEHVRAKAALVVAREARDAVRGHRDQVQSLVEAGVAARADLLQVEAQLAAAEVAVTNTELGVDISRRALALLITSEGESAPTIEIGEDVSVPVEVPAGTLGELEARALDQRPEMRALTLTRQARGMEARAHAASRYPQLSVAGNVSYANPNTRYIPQTREFRTTWDLSAVLSWSPNDALVGEGRRRLAAAQEEEIRAQELQLREGVRMEVTVAYQALLTARASLAGSEAAVVAAQESYRVRLQQLEQGTIVATELEDARTALTRAELARVDAAILMRVARAQLARAIGEDGATP